jgi:hypothetical protein
MNSLDPNYIDPNDDSITDEDLDNSIISLLQILDSDDVELEEHLDPDPDPFNDGEGLPDWDPNTTDNTRI